MCSRDADHFTKLSEQLEAHKFIPTIRFTVGLFIFFIALVSNIISDSILRNLRKPGDNKYYIPKGFLFEYVSCPNYFCEICEWFGFSVATNYYPAAILFWLVCVILLPLIYLSFLLVSILLLFSFSYAIILQSHISGLSSISPLVLSAPIDGINANSKIIPKTAKLSFQTSSEHIYSSLYSFSLRFFSIHSLHSCVLSQNCIIKIMMMIDKKYYNNKAHYNI